MYKTETKIRVRYGETDKMGYVYYGYYSLYHEEARTDALRELGISYKNLEESGIILPVVEYNTKYIKAAYYDDVLSIKTTVKEMPSVKIKFDYEIYNEKNELINQAYTMHVFIDKKINKPCKAPFKIIDNLSEFFED